MIDASLFSIDNLTIWIAIPKGDNCWKGVFTCDDGIHEVVIFDEVAAQLKEVGVDD